MSSVKPKSDKIPKSEKNKEKKERSKSNSNWLTNLIHFDPVNVVSDAWDAFDMWRATRPWQPFILMIPGMILILSFLAATTYATVFLKSYTLQDYAKKAQEVDPGQRLSNTRIQQEKSGEKAKLDTNLDIDADYNPEESALSDEEKDTQAEKDIKDSLFAELLYRRILQIRSDNKLAKYYVARMHGQRGSLAQARSMMSSLAPSDGVGHAPAHAWLAADCLTRAQTGEKFDRLEFEHHMNAAIDFKGELWWAQILYFYSKLLEQDKKPNEAINMLQRAANIDPKFMLALSNFHATHNQPLQAKETAEQAAIRFSENLGKRTETETDRIIVAEAYLLAGKADEAVKTILEGQRINPDNLKLKRALSEVYRRMFRSDIKQNNGEVSFKMGLLNSAIEADPTNPAIGDDIMMLQAMGVTVDEVHIKRLRENLAAGGATAVTHLLLGNAYYNKYMEALKNKAPESLYREHLNQAMNHWQLAQGLDPNMVLALNNLGVLMSKLDPPKIEEGLKLVDRAIELTGGTPEFYDSRGEILTTAERYLEAITAFEKSLRYPIAKTSDAERNISTREKLVKAYEKAGLNDLIDAQLTIISKLRENIRLQLQADQTLTVAPKAMGPAPSPKKDNQADPKATDANQATSSPQAKTSNAKNGKDAKSVAPGSDTSKSATKNSQSKATSPTDTKDGKQASPPNQQPKLSDEEVLFQRLDGK